MIQSIPTLLFSGKSISTASTTRTSRDNQLIRTIGQSEKELLQKDVQYVNLKYFKKRDMFSTVSKHQSSIHFYTKNNSILFGIWIDIFLSFFSNRHIDIKQILSNDKFNLQIRSGVPQQFIRLNKNETMKTFLLQIIEQLQKVNNEQNSNFQKIFLGMITDYPFLTYCGIAFVRQIGSIYLKENKQKYQFQLIGNQQELFKDYLKELYHNSLSIIANSLNLSILIKYSCNKQSFGQGQFQLNLQKIGSHFSLIKDTLNDKAEQNSVAFNSTISSGSNKLQAGRKICNRCMNIKTGRFCDCRKKKNGSEKVKKKCNKCEAQYIFVCKCY